uniref:Uncharacterized protein n=1 Tax=Globisporangium ultimum (strain ATCC 200006 / CBS 805.95 / DAOM BR144) TaxID=431595 RepID=K3X3B6_GLOUD
MPTASIAAVPDTPFVASSAKELEPAAFCSPPRQSFQLLLHENASESDGDAIFKDEFQLPPRRAPSVTRQQPRPSRDRTSNATKASSSKPIVTRNSSKYASSPSSSSSSTKLGESGQPQKKRPKRKASYLARKEEKEELLKHLDELQTQLNTLKYQTVVHGNFRAQNQARTHLTKNILTDAIQKHQLAVAGLQAMLSKYSEHSPIETTIRLGTELSERRATLLQLKDHKILEAKHFIEERSRGLDVTKTYVEEERFETTHGDFCSLRFDIVPIRGAASVKSVFDTMLYYIGNIEIMLSETMGHVTIREDDDNPDKNISHHRLVTSIGNGLQIETNTVLFSELTETVDGGAMGVIVGDFIDDDELYPYRPHERIRRDVSVMLTASSYIEKAAPSRTFGGNESDGGNSTHQADEATEELIVVLKRWSLGKLHKTELPVPGTVLQDIRDIYAKWSEETVKAVRLNPPPPLPMHMPMLALPLSNEAANGTADIVL